MKRWQAMALEGPTIVTAFAIAWLGSLLYAAPPAPSPAPYSVTLILPTETISCRGGADALTYSQTAIVVDCSADRVFASSFD